MHICLLNTVRTYKDMNTKVCTKCNKEFPATREYFYFKEHGKYGLRADCIKCCQEYDKKRHAVYDNIEYVKNKREEYFKNNREKILKRYREYNQKNKIKRNAYSREYYLKNKDRFKLWRKEYLNTENGKKVIGFHKKKDIRRKRKIQKILTNDLTYKQWLQCLDYFENKCAYCGADNISLAMDHFIPITKFGATSKNNIIPCCSKCNSSKNNKDFHQWYKRQSYYKKERYQKILDYIGDTYGNSALSHNCNHTAIRSKGKDFNTAYCRY
jgi:hypothetical protein